MKKRLKIGEISKYYNISVDSLRYYERIGLVQPQRLANGYRIYEYVDLWKLNVIKELRMLDFPLEKVKTYFNNRTISTTMSILNEELETINQKIIDLNGIKRNIREKIRMIEKMTGDEWEKEIRLVEKPRRGCILLADNVENIEQIDLYFRRLQLKSKEKISLLGSKELCIFMPPGRLNEENIYSQVFSFFPETTSTRLEKQCDFIMPKGNYLSVRYRGPHSKSRDYAQAIVSYAQANNYTLITDLFEICFIDIHETNNRQEYITGIEVGVAEAEQNGTPVIETISI